MTDTFSGQSGPRRPWRTDDEWRRLRRRIDVAEAAETPHIGRPWKWRALAAAAALVLAAGLGWKYQRTTQSAAAMQVASTAAGGQLVIRLPDSSVITLGPASSIRYRIDANAGDVELDGLAHFEVTHNEARPFVVRARNAITTDLGTEFTIRAYASDSAVQVAVSSGAVSLTGTGSSRSIDLRAGSVGTVGGAGIASRDSLTLVETSTAWTHGRLAFDDETLAAVAMELSRWFDVDIRIANDALSRRRITAIYASPSLAGVLDALTTTVGAQYERTGRRVVIRPRPM